MPENYVTLYNTLTEKQNAEMMARALPRILTIAECIYNAQALPEEAVTGMDRFKSAAVNTVFYPTIISAKGFHTTESCISCGKCAQLCPLNNIKLSAGKPQWGSDGTHCMACISGCPSKAIEYKNKTQRRSRYYNTEIPQCKPLNQHNL